MSSYQQLGENEYHIHVGYDMSREQKVLEAHYRGGHVSQMFYDLNPYRWAQHSSRAKVASKPGGVILALKDFSKEEVETMKFLESENVIAWGMDHGLVPADAEEVHAFGISPATKSRKNFYLAGLGSFVVDSYSSRHVAALKDEYSIRNLICRENDLVWYANTTFLFRKVT